MTTDIRKQPEIKDNWKAGDRLGARAVELLSQKVNTLESQVRNLQLMLERHGIIFARFNRNLKPGYQYADVSQLVMRGDAVADGSDQWTFLSTATAPAVDPQMGVYLTGERHPFLNVGGKYIPLGIVFHRGTLTAELAQNGSAACTLDRWNHDTEAWEATADPAISVTVWDALLDTGETIANGGKVLILEHLQSRHLLAIAARCP